MLSSESDSYALFRFPVCMVFDYIKLATAGFSVEAVLDGTSFAA